MIDRLYHYSKLKFDAIKTREAQGISDKRTQTVRDNYNQTMSFYLEPAPLDILGTIFKHGYNDFWYTGNHIYEYEILIKDMPEFSYEIVESKLKYRIWNDPKYDHYTDEQWRELLQKKLRLAGEIGDTKAEFVKIASKLMGELRDDYIALDTNPWFTKYNNQTKYAAYCTHVMIVPEGGVVNYHSCKQAIVGNQPLPIK